MADDLAPSSANDVDFSLLMRFFVFFVFSGLFFLVFMWVVFIRSVAANVSLESSIKIYEDGVLVSEDVLIGDYEVSDSYYEVYFDEIDLMRFTAGSSFSVSEVTSDSGFYIVQLELNEGGVWISNMGGVLDLMLKAGDFVFQNVDGYYYVEVQDGEVFAYAYRHPLRVHFLDQEENSLNSYLIPEGYYGEYESSGVSSVVADLRYAKLIKEYPFYVLSDDRDRDFWGDFVAIDDSRYIGLLSSFKSVVRQNYDIYTEELPGFIEQLRQYLTFVESKKAGWAEQETLRKLNKALYLSVRGETDESLLSLIELDEGSVVSAEYRAYLNYLNVVLNISLYGGDLYLVKDYLRGLLYSDSDEGSLIVLRERLNEMYDLANDGEIALAKEAFSAYERGFLSFFAMPTSQLSAFRKDISEERELLAVLLTRESGFYDPQYFDLLDDFERAIFRVAASGVDLDEERQAFVSGKVKVLNNIEELLRVSGISVSDATDVMLYLLDSADVLMDEIDSRAAILSYFEAELFEAAQVLEFINSTEYSSLSGSFDGKLGAYLRNKEDIDNLKDYLQSLHLGSPDEGDLTLEEAKAIVYAAFSGAEVAYTAVSSLGDSGYRLFDVDGGKIGGIAFEAKYDREGELFYDLKIGDVRLATGVSLFGLAEVADGLLKEEFSESPVPSPLSSVEENDLSYAEQLAISLLTDYLSGYGIYITSSNVVSSDLSENLFYLKGVAVGEFELEFFVHASDDLITDVTVIDLYGIEGVFYVGDFVAEMESRLADGF